METIQQIMTKKLCKPKTIVALAYLVFFISANAFANHWKGVPFLPETQENLWGGYYDDGLKSTTDFRYLFYDYEAGYFMGMKSAPSTDEGAAMTNTYYADENCVWYANRELYHVSSTYPADASNRANIWREIDGKNKYYYSQSGRVYITENKPTTNNLFFLRGTNRVLAKYNNNAGYNVSWDTDKWISNTSSDVTKTPNVLAYLLATDEGPSAYVFKETDLNYYMTYEEGSTTPGSPVSYRSGAPTVRFDADKYIWHTRLNKLNSLVPTALYQIVNGTNMYLTGFSGASYSTTYYVRTGFDPYSDFYINNSNKLYRKHNSDKTAFYTYFENGHWEHKTDATYAKTTAYLVTITDDVEYLAELPTVTGPDVLAETGSQNYGLSTDEYYYVNAKNYRFENTDHFGGGNALTPAELTYSWEVSDNISSYVSLTNGTTEAPTLVYTSLVSEITQGTLTCTISYSGHEIATVTKNVVLAGGHDSLKVTLNDLLDHDLSIYNSSTPNYLVPCDVNITYYGYGKYNSSVLPGSLTSNTSLTDLEPTTATVAVGHASAELEHTFIYNKTLEKSPSDANWSYTTIANPFYRRPKIGGDYYGFAAWRVKSGSNISGFSVGSIIPANTKLSITGPGNIELEAVWVKANVVTSSSGTLSDSYTPETQFYIYTSSGYIESFKDKPCTYTSVYPDGSNYDNGSGVIKIYSNNKNFTLSADTRIEYLDFGFSSTDNYLDAKGHDLVYGRGVGNTYYNSVYGWLASNSSVTENVSFTDRFESGKFSNIYLTRYISGYVANITGKADVMAVFGSDYDRARNVNTNIVVDNEVFVGYNLGFTNDSNTRFDLTVKSGTFGVNHVNDGTQNNEKKFYLGFAFCSVGGGARRAEILGGHFIGTISGGLEKYANSSAEIRIKNGTFDGFVYGAAQFGAAYGQRDIIVTGGTFNSFIAGGCNGTDPNGGVTNGNTNIYFGGAAHIDSCLFGAGFGRHAVYGTTDEDSYYVSASNIVVADDAHVTGDVYGGGNNGYALGGSTISVLGGTIDGSVFGGSNKSKGGGSNITVSGGTISRNVYGGSNSKGTLSATANVTINGGSIGGEVYGAGCGENTGAANTVVNINAGIPNNVFGGGENGSCNNTVVNINGNVGGSVYGGGEHGKSATAVVNINSGTVSGNVFAGALGNKDELLVNGNKTLNMNGGTVNGSLYGASRNANDGGQTAAVVTKEVGTGTTTATHAPFGTNSSNDYSWAEIIYPASSLQAGQIKNISFNCNAAASHTCQSLQIYLAHRSSASFSSTTNWTPQADLNLVYSHQNVVIGASKGWQKFEFDRPFEYNGTDNLVVIVVRKGTNPSTDLNYLCSSGGTVTNPTLYRHSDAAATAVYSSTAAGTHNSNRANAKFDILPSSVVVGTGTYTSAYQGMGNYFKNYYNESFFLKDELNTSGFISSLSYYVGTPISGGLDCSELKIYMGHTDKEEHNGKTDWTPIENLTLAYSRENTNVCSKTGWEEFVLDTPFYYDGIHNLVVVVSRKSSSSNTTVSYRYSESEKYVNLYKGGDDESYAYYDGDFSEHEPTKNRAHVKFNFGTSSFINISGGTIAQNIYGGGFYGSIDGNTFVNIGKNAIENSPCKAINTNKPVSVSAGNINIGGSVYSGSDWGEMSGSGFGSSNISGNSDIYIDGTGHSTINAGNALYGAGTSSFAGKGGSDIFVRNYGSSPSSPKSFSTIQHASNLVIDNSCLNLIGAGDQEQNNVSEPYAVKYVANELRLVNGSSISINAPLQQVANLGSYSCSDIYAASPVYTATSYSSPSNTINMTEGETGHYINVVDTTSAATYGAVKGYFRFGGTLQAGTSFAYARQKQAVSSPCYDSSYENPDDGGFVSTNNSYNSYDEHGQEGTGQLHQICYINHPQGTKDPNYYREWVLKTATTGSEVEGTLTAAVDRNSSNNILTTSTTMMIPSAEGSYFILTDIDFGDDAGLVPAGRYYNSDKYAYLNTNAFAFDGVEQTQAVASALNLMNEDVNSRFGLTMTPKSGFGSADLTSWIINADALELYDNSSKITLPTNPDEVLTVDFTLTYSNHIDMNAELSPVVLTLTEYNSSDQIVNEVHVKLNIITKTTVLQDTELDVYIVQNGQGSSYDSTRVNLLLPMFTMTGSKETCKFTVTDITSSLIESGFDASLCADAVQTAGLNKVAIQYGAVRNSDYTFYWTGGDGFTEGMTHNNCDFSGSEVIGSEDGRFASSIGFIVRYNGSISSGSDALIGTVTYTIELDNYSETIGGVSDNNFTVTLNIYRRSSLKNWYLSHHGNSFNNGFFPDKPKKSLYNVFKSGYAAGDRVFIVDTLFVSSQQEWDGLSYGSINIYRYTGSHTTSSSSTDEATPYTGTLIHVLDGGNLQMTGVTIDGMATGSPSLSDTEINKNTSYDIGNGVVSQGPAIQVDANAQIELRDGTIAYNNNTLNHNVETVGGVQMLGSMTIGGNVQINNNMAHGIEGNIYLPSYDNYLEINAEGLDPDASIGITKLDFDNYAFSPIANSPDNSMAQTIYNQENFYADNGIGKLYYDPNDNATNNTVNERLYLSKSWVAAVKSEPAGFNIGDLDSEEDLAWAISYVNGYNGQEPHPEASINLSSSLNMNDYIWVPIGDRYSPYSGTFTGNANVIDSIISSINRIGAKGLFGYTDGATIKGAFVKSGELEMTDDNACVGGIVGNANKTTIDFCQSGLATSSNYGYAGGLVGRMENSTVVNSMAVGEVNGNIAGGVAGYTTASSEVVEHSAIENTFVNANIEGLDYTGGIAGYNEIDLTNNYVHADATINGNNAGELVGHNVMSLAISAVDDDMLLNDGTDTMEQVPFYEYYADYVLHSQFIQPALTDIPSGSTITKLVFYCFSVANTNAISDITVKIRPIADTTDFQKASFMKMPASSTQTVYTGSLTAVDKKITIEFATPFVYSDNSMNLLIDFSKQSGGSYNRIYFYGTSTTSNAGVANYSNTTIYQHKFLPKMTIYYERGSAGSATTGITKCYYAQGSSLPLAKTNDGADTDVFSDCNYFTPTAAYDYANQGGNRVGTTSTRLAAQMNTNTSGYLPWTYTTANTINGDMPVLSNTNFTCMGQAASSRFIDYGTNPNNVISLYNNNADGGTINLTANADINTLPVGTVTLYINEDVAVTQSVNGNINAYTGITMKNEHTFGAKNRTWHFFSSPLTAAPLGLIYPDSEVHNPYESSENPGTVYPYLGNVDPETNGYIPNDMGYTSNGSSVTNPGTYMDFDLYAYYENDYHWINLKRNSNSHFHQDGQHAQITTYPNEVSFTPGKGYIFALGNNSDHSQVFVQSNGILNNSNTITMPITRNGTHLTGYNFLGNPYQSYLDFDKFSTTNKLIWKNDAHVGYIIYDAELEGFVSFGYDINKNCPSQGSITAGKYINMHQGFMVVSDGSATQAVFDNLMRDITPNATHFRNEQPAFPVVNLIATDANGKKDFTVVEVNRPSNGGVRKLTGIYNGNAMMYVHYDNANLGLAFIEGTPNYVPLWFESQEDGIYTLTWNTANFDLGYMHLVDNLTGNDIDMLSNNHYTFQSNKIDSKARFRLVFKPLAIEEQETQNNVNFAFLNGNELVVNGEGDLQLVDMNGRILLTQYVPGQQNRIVMPKLAVGMYLLRMANADGVRVQKLVIRK